MTTSNDLHENVILDKIRYPWLLSILSFTIYGLILYVLSFKIDTLVLLPFATLFILLFALLPFTQEHGKKINFRTVKIQENRFVVEHQICNETITEIQVNLNECFWYRGYINNDTCYFIKHIWQLLYYQRAIIIYHPQTLRAYSCGLTNGHYEKWVSLLNQKCVLKLPNRNPFEPLIVILSIVPGIAIVPVGVNFILTLNLPNSAFNCLFLCLLFLPTLFGLIASFITGNQLLYVHKNSILKFIISSAACMYILSLCREIM